MAERIEEMVARLRGLDQLKSGGAQHGWRASRFRILLRREAQAGGR